MLRKTLSLGLVAAALWGIPEAAEAFQVKRVIRNTFTLLSVSSEEIKTFDLTPQLGGVPLDLTKTFIIATTRINDDNNARADAYVTLDDPQTVLARRRVGTTDLIVEFMVVEFVDGVTVQSGITVFSETQAGTPPTKNITLPASADTTRSFPLLSRWSFNANNSSAVDERNTFTADLTTATTLQIRRRENASGYNNDLYYQVVTFDADVVVKNGSVDIDGVADAGETSDDGQVMVASLSPTVNTAKSLLFFTSRPIDDPGGVEAHYAVDGQLTANNAITFTRVTSSTTQDQQIVYSLVEFTNEMFVQQGRTPASGAGSLPAGTATATVGLPTATVLARSAGSLSVSGGTGTQTADLSDVKVTGQLSGATNLVLTRASSGTLARVSYSMAEFPPLQVEAPNSAGIVWKVGETRTITWKHADDTVGHAVAIELSNDGGGSWLGTAITCTEGARNAEHDLCTWTIPDTLGATSIIGNNLRIRVRDTVLTARNYDLSNVSFEIKGTVTVTIPSAAGIVWSVGAANQPINWTNTGDHTTTKARIKLQNQAGSDIVTISDCLVNIEDNTVSWASVGDYLGTDRRIRVESCADATGVFDVSDNNFEIRGSITVTAPNGSETYETQKSYSITWNKTGTFAPLNEVNLYYSKNSGGSFSLPNGDTIALNQPAGAASGSYSWTVPTAAISDFARIKVEQSGNAVVNDVSNADFSIKPSIVVNSPNGSEVWLVGESRNITWTTNGAGLANVKIEYSTTGLGGTYNPIVENDGTANDGIVTNNGTRAWDVPDAIGGNVAIRISNPSIPTIFDTSDAVFRIKGQTKVLIPNGGEVWPVGGARTIQWSNLGTFTGTVEIRYSTDATTYPAGNTIVTGLANSGASGSYNWNPVVDVTGGINNTMRIKVIPSDTTNVGEDTSDANFSVKGTLTLTAPNGGQTWVYGGPNQNITWTKTGSIGTVELRLSTNSGSSFGSPFATGLDPTTGTPYAWVIPDNLSTQARIRVQLVTDTTVYDDSDADFIVKGALTLGAPNGSETWRVGETTRNITWTRSGTTGPMANNVDLHYSTDGGANYSGTISVNTVLASALLFNWNPIPAAAQSNTVKVRIRLSNDTTTSDVSDANFFVKPNLVVSAPNGGQNWIVGASQNITWTTSGTVGNVNLLYSTDGGGSYPPTPNIATNLTNVGSYAWTIPDAIGTQLRVKAEDFADAAGTNDQSDANFTVKGSLTLSSPNGGETWLVGENRNITWTKTGTLSGNVKLLYSTDGGATFPDPANVITSTAVVTALSHTWTVPDMTTTLGANTFRIRIVYLNDTSVTDDSDAHFNIKGSLAITAPNSGEVWDLGTAQNITWTKTGTLGSVRLDLSYDAGVDGYSTVITASTSSTSPFVWTIPTNATLTTQARVKISMVSGSAAAADTSDANFRLRGVLAVAAPNGSETWTVGTSQNITWSVTGGVSNVKLDYSRDAGADGYPYAIIASTPAGTGSYAWTVTENGNGNTNQARVRITDAADATVVDVSNANFTIRGALTLTVPNGGENWVVGTSQNITWTKAGAIPNVILEYSVNGGLAYPNTIVASTTGTTYAWAIPNAIGTQLRVKVSDTNATVQAVPDESNGNFTVKGSITVTAPNGSEQWGIGTAQTITWAKTGTLTGNLKLEYSTDAGATYPVGNLISNTVLASATSYNWTVADNPTIQARVRITQLDDTSVNDQSDANFRIKGTLTMTSPNGTENWKVGESRNVTWTRGGSIATVKLDYSTDSGATYPGVIVASTPGGNLSYAWTIPDVSSTTVRVKVEDVVDDTVKDSSDADFTIKPIVTLTAPNGGETWIVGESRNITWTKAGTIANVKLVYSTDAGATYPEAAPDNTIIASTPGANLSYAWTVPDKIGNQLRVKLVKTDDTAVVDTSDANFSIKGSLTITSPNGAETWIVNESRNITWTKTGSIANVKLEYSKNGFTNETQTFTIIASTAAAPLSYGWTVADAIGAQVRVRVSDVSDAAVNDISNANFTIKGALVLNAPNGGQVWAVGSSQNITWTRTGSITNVKLEYSTNSGGTFPNVISASTDASTGTYAWTIPDSISSQLRVRVSDASDATVLDDSNADFKIVGVLVVTAPNGAEIWTYNTTQNITWTRTGSIANVKLEYSTDSGATFPNVIIASTGAALQTYAWTVPNAHSATVRVRVLDTADNSVFDTSNANFKIRSSLTLTAPDGGEVWTVGTGQTVTWTSSGTVNNVKLEYSTDGGSTYPNLVTASAPNTGSYSWTVPDAISTSVRAKITDVDDSDAFDASNGNFKIRGALLLTAPNGGEQWGIATSKNVTWTRTGSIVNVKLEYSTNGFNDELQTTVIVASTGAAAGTYAWTIPDAPGVNNKVRVTDASDPTVLDLSNNPFSIKGSLTITAPNGAETWIVGSDYNITWAKFGSITNAELRYSTNNGSTWPAGQIIIASTNASAGTYTWTIPDAISNQVLVRITDTLDSSTTDDSNAVFSIKGSLTVTAPNGSEVWIVGDAQNITWTKTGTIPTVTLDYSTDGGTTYPNVITASVASTPSTYAWTIPDAISSQARVKISNTADATVNDASNANFSIKGSLTLNAPNGGEVWTVGSSQSVTWSKVGSIANVVLEYSTDGGVSYPNVIIASTPAAAGSYTWTIPNAITTTARVRVTNVADAAVNDASNANFKIAGSLTLTAPNGGEAWLISGSQNVTWTLTGSIANVKLEYSTDGGTTYPNVIVASTAADPAPVDGAGSYAWTIPDAPTTTARVKVSNTADATVFDASNGNFSLRGSLTLTAPNGSEVWVVGEGRNITWTKQGSLSTAELRYSTNSGSTYPNVITASTSASALTYAWTVPDAIATTMRVKITDTSDSAVTDASDVDFKIKGAVTLTAPNGANVWIVGASQNVTWTRVGSFANVKLDYSTNGGTTYPNAITASTPAAGGSYAWTVPDAIGTTLRVQVSDAADSTVVDTSNDNFQVKGSLTLNAPNGGETWIVGASQNITWSKTGTLGSCKLDYSTNSGIIYPNAIAASVLCADLTYAWTIPDSISSTVRVQITNLVDASVADASNADFAIKGSLTLTSPNGSEVWIVGATQNITWTKTGSIATVRLDYSTNGGVTYPNVITTSYSANGSPFLWTVPDNMSSTVKVRVQNTADASVEDASNNDFKIAGSFTLTSPNGAEKWPAGSTQSLTWTKTGSIVNAKLEYSTNGGSTFPNLIVATTPAGNLSYAWTLGSTTTTQARVRISDVSDTTVFDTSNADFKIMGGFTLTAPNGGEVWVVGSSQNITWSNVGSVANVKLSYSVNGGTTYPNTIAATTTNTGSYAWTIPDAIGTTLRVKAEDVLDADAFDESNANFKIKGALAVTAPNGGDIWNVASAQNITWTRTGSIANIKLEYSTDGGTTYPGANLIVASVGAGVGTYAWTIPDAISTTVRVKVTDLNDATVFDESNANFTIRGAFTLTSPNGGEKWKVGSSQTITWTTFGTIPNAKLEYSTDGGATFPNVIVASVANSGSYGWTIPNAIAQTVRVRVLNAADVGTLDASNADFKIMAGFTVTAPNGGEVLVSGASYNIAWTTAGTVSNVKLEYSTNSGSTYPNVITASSSNTGTFNWTVPDAIFSTVRVRVSDATDTADAFDTSDGDFKIRAGFTVTAPNGSEAWAVNSSRTITWTTAGTVSNVKLEYSTDGGATFPNVISASVVNTGTYAWTIPDAITTAARVKVSDVNDSTAFDTSNTNFKIQGSLTMTAPNGGEKWTVASVRTVTWNRTGSIAFVKLDFSTDGGSIYAPITASTSNTGTYAWTIPDTVSTNCLVKVTDTNDATVTDASDAAFKIQAGFVVTSPNGGEVWGVGSSRTITWTTNGTVLFVKLDYSTDSGATYPSLITSSTANVGSYGWTVPDAISGNVRVRVSQTTDAEAFDTSDGNFRIRATVTLSAPNGAEVWRVGQSRNITWSVVGTIPNVKLQYSRDGFNVDIQTINAAAPNTGTYAWTIPDAISNTVRVRASDPNDIGAFDDSNADFRIIANFTVTSPNGGEQWTVASAQTITWTSAGTVANVKLEYSTNSGGTWVAILGLTPNDGSQAWTVPDAITPNGRIRVSDPVDATSDDISDADFKIKALFTLTAPNGGEIWTVGESRNVTWTNTGTVPNVKLEYSTNSGSTYPNVIAASVGNTGTYAWTIPDAISTNVRVKVTSTTDVDGNDASDADLKIRGAFTLTAPNGGEGWGIAQTRAITWNTTGTMPTVKLTYSTNGGGTFPNTITASVTNTNTYNWVIPDVPSTTVRVRVESTADGSVYDDSNANFSIQGTFTLTAPNGGEIWGVSEVRNITWSWGGTIPNVKLLYSTNGGSTYPNVIAASAPNGIGSSGTFQYAWTVPDAISTTVRVRVEDALDAAVFDTSNADFKIQGKLTMVSPNGGERWVVNESKTIQWTTGGTVPNVKLEYSTDGGTSYPNVIVASVANAGTYAWTVPNTLSTTARVRVSNTADATVLDGSDANFTIDLYQITFRVKDLLSNNNLDQLTITSLSGPAGYSWAASGLTSSIVQGLQYGTWSIKFTRVSYGDQAVNVVVDRDQTIDVFMETQVVHIWEAATELAYNPATDTVTTSSTLKRDGSTVTGATSCTVKLYDGTTLIKTLSSASTPDANGFYTFTWNAPTGLIAGKVYNVVTTMTIATGGTFNTPRTFSITEVKKLQDVQDTVNAKLNVDLVTFQNNVRGDLDLQKQAIDLKLTDFETKSNVQIAALKSGADNIKQTGDDLQKRTEDLEGTNLRFAGSLMLPDKVLIGDKNVRLGYRAIAGIQPLITVTAQDQNNKDVVVVSAVPMTPNTVNPDLYEYTLEKISAPPYTPGKFVRVLVQAQTFIYKLQSKTPEKNVEAGSFIVESTTLSTLEGLVAGQSGVKDIAENTLEAVRAIQQSFNSGNGGDVIGLLQSLNRKMDALPRQVAGEIGKNRDSADMKNTLNELSEQIRTLAGDNMGQDFTEIIGKALDESASLKDVRKKTDKVQGATELMQVLMEQKLGGVDDPVVHVIYQ